MSCGARSRPQNVTIVQNGKLLRDTLNDHNIKLSPRDGFSTNLGVRYMTSFTPCVVKVGRMTSFMVSHLLCEKETNQTQASLHFIASLVLVDFSMLLYLM